MPHLIFFDDKCPLCQRSIRIVLKLDKNKYFRFSSLKGKTAQRLLSGPLAHLKKANTLVLIENYTTPKQRLWIRGRAVFRIFWLFGHKWLFLGWLCFIPFGTDLLYRLLARHRHRLKGGEEEFTESDKKRFLD